MPEMLAADSPSDTILDAAATVIAANNRHVGDYWAGAPQAQWRPGMACDVTAAIGIALGFTSSTDVDWHIVPAVIDGGDDLPHPAFRALMAHLRVESMQQVWQWSDAYPAERIAAELRACAQALRGTGVPA